MPLRNFASSATSALWWYHLPHESQYKGANAELYEKVARMGGREEYAQIIAEMTHDIDGQVLEIGAGTGLISARLAAQHEDRLLCTDIEPAALALNPHTRKRVADCRALPLTDESMHAIVGVGVYRYLGKNTLTEFWSEMRRVLHASGKLVLGEFQPRTIGMRGLEIDPADADGLFSFQTCHITPARARLGRHIIRIGTNVTYTFLPQ